MIVLNILRKILAYQNPPKQCAATQFISSKFGGSFLTGEFLEDNQTTNNENAERYQDSFVAAIPEARVLGKGCVISPDGFYLARDIAQDFGCDQKAHWLIKKDSLLKPTKFLPNSSWVASINLSSNYYHWLFEEVPRIIQGLTEGKHRVLVSCENSVQAEFLKMFDIKE